MLIKWNDPWTALQSEMHSLRDEMQKVFGGLLSSSSSRRHADDISAVRILEDQTGYTIEMAMPGIAKDAIELEVDTDNQLIIKAHRKRESEDVVLHRHERAFGDICHTFDLPNDVDRGQIDAELRDGLLHVSVSKRPELQHRSIEVN